MVRITGRYDSIIRVGILTAFIAVSMTATVAARSKKKTSSDVSTVDSVAASTTISTAPSNLPPGGLEWKSIIIGEATSSEKNSIDVGNNGKSVTITAGKKDGTSTGGKVVTSHDGIAYYYTAISPMKNFVLSAKVKVNFFAKPTPDNQEAFGIMARDALGKNLDTNVHSSNIALVGGFHGQLQSTFRNFVKDSTGVGGKFENTHKFGGRPANDGTATYTLTMRKTNTGYHVSVDNAPEKIYYRPKELEVLDPANIYVGFFAARVASITVTDIVMTLTDASSDPAGVVEPVKKVLPVVNVVSPVTTGLSNYLLGVTTNYSGVLKIRCNNFDSSYIVDKTTGLFKEFWMKKGIDTFHLVLIPDSLKSDTVKVQHVVRMKTFGAIGGIVYVSPTGTDSGNGTSTRPLDLQTAIDYLQPSQTIILMPGIYKMKKPIVIAKGNDGTVLRLKSITGSINAVLDFSEASEGISVFGNYWKLYGFDVTKGAKGGIRVFGKYNIFERLNTYANGNTGLLISGNSSDRPELWPSNNLVLNCESYNNRDASENDADGFSTKLACGPGNVFRGCIAHHNGDDGWDLYSRLDIGPIGSVVIENCISYSNGMLSNGNITKGDGKGFELGGDGVEVSHVLRNSIAFGNKTIGITNNSNPGVIVENCNSFDNGALNFDISVYNNAIPKFVVNNNISFHSLDGKDDKVIDSLKSPNNYFYKGKVSSNSDGKILTRDDFKSIKLDVFKRNPDGSIAGFNYTTVKPTHSITSGAKITDLTKITKISPAPKVVPFVLVPAPDSTRIKAAAAKADSLKIADSIKAAAKKARADSIKTADSIKVAVLKAKTDSIKAAAALKKAKADSVRVADSIRVAAVKKARADSIKTADSIKVAVLKAKTDSIKAAAALKNANADNMKTVDTMKTTGKSDSAKIVNQNVHVNTDTLKVKEHKAESGTTDSSKIVPKVQSLPVDTTKKSVK